MFYIFFSDFKGFFFYYIAHPMQPAHENVKPSRFLRKKNSRSTSPLPSIETHPKNKERKKNKEGNILERRKGGQKYTVEPNISDETDIAEQRILKWLEENNITMVLPDEKEHDYIQNNINNIFQKYEKNSCSSVFTSNSNSSSPYKVASVNTSPRLNINNSPLMKKRMEGGICNSAIRLQKTSQDEENEKTEKTPEKKSSLKGPIEFFKLE